MRVPTLGHFLSSKGLKPVNASFDDGYYTVRAFPICSKLSYPWLLGILEYFSQHQLS